MTFSLEIRPLEQIDIPQITKWARNEGFAPGIGDVGIYRHTDNQGLWVGCLGGLPIGCIAGVRYNSSYGFLGLFLVEKKHRGNGYGLALWKHALAHLEDLPCIGLEAAPDRVKDYSDWGFKKSSPTTRWQWIGEGELRDQDIDIEDKNSELMVIEGGSIPSMVAQSYDAKREPSPRPHFLSDWLKHPAGTVLALVDRNGFCHGFGRIRPCLLRNEEGWRVGPLLADSPALAGILLRRLVKNHPGKVLLDAPGLNPNVTPLLSRLGFEVISQTIRMYRGLQPPLLMNEVYGLACLELG